MIPRVASIKS